MGNVAAIFEERATERPHQLIESAGSAGGVIFALLHGPHKQMSACGSHRPRLEPNLRVNLDVGKFAGHLPQMRVEPLVSAFLIPCRIDFLDRIAEDGTEPMLDADRAREFFFDGVDAHLRDIGPDAQDVREMLYFDDAHDRGLGCVSFELVGGGRH